MKKILLSLLTMMLFTGIFAQVEPPLDIDKINKQLDSVHEVIINKSDYVFEGNIIKSDIYFRNNSVICSDIIKITKVFRGNIQTGTIEVLSYSSFNMDGDQRVHGIEIATINLEYFFVGSQRNSSLIPSIILIKLIIKRFSQKRAGFSIHLIVVAMKE